MNIKKLMLYSIAVVSLVHVTPEVYTKDTQDDISENQTRQGSAPAEHNPLDHVSEAEYKQLVEIGQFIEATFPKVTAQTERIAFCLQQIELAVNNEKLSFRHASVSKSEFLAEIKIMKDVVAQIQEFYTTQLAPGDDIVQGLCFNKALIQYLLPVMKKSITTLKVEALDKHIMEQVKEFKTFAESLQNNPIEKITKQLNANRQDLEKMINICDNIGLTTLNKMYRDLADKPLPLYGKSAIATAQDIAFWGTAGVATYCMMTYGLPASTPIWGTAKELTDTDKISPETYTWMQDGKPYRRKIATEILPGKAWLGDFHGVLAARQLGDEAQREAARAKFTGISYLHDGTLTYSQDHFMLGALGIISSFTKNHIYKLYKNGKESFEKFFKHYIRGGGNQSSQNSNDVPKTYFTDIIGGKDMKQLAQELADYLKNPTRYEQAGIAPSTGYLLVGPPQTGKSYFAKALKTLIDETFADSPEKVKFFNITRDIVRDCQGFQNLFRTLEQFSPCIVFIDELDLYGARRGTNDANTQDLLTGLNGVETDPTKKVIVIAATNRPEQLDFALTVKGRLGNIITFDYPTYECRKQYLEKQLLKKNISISADMIDTIAQETDGNTYNMIDEIISQSCRLSAYAMRPVTEADFETTLDREVRKIKSTTQMTADEKELVALYQAGQAAARYVLQTEQQIIKITINTVDKAIKSKEGFSIVNEQKSQQHENSELLPDSRNKATRLGYVFTMSKTNNHELISDEEEEKELMALLAGHAALELIKGKTFNNFGKEDRAKILDILEKKIAQGNPISNKIRAEALEQKDALYKKVKALLQNHTTFIQSITNELLQHSTLNKKQWEALTAQYPLA